MAGDRQHSPGAGGQDSQVESGFEAGGGGLSERDPSLMQQMPT